MGWFCSISNLTYMLQTLLYRKWLGVILQFYDTQIEYKLICIWQSPIFFIWLLFFQWMKNGVKMPLINWNKFLKFVCNQCNQFISYSKWTNSVDAVATVAQNGSAMWIMHFFNELTCTFDFNLIKWTLEFLPTKICSHTQVIFDIYSSQIVFVLLLLLLFLHPHMWALQSHYLLFATSVFHSIIERRKSSGCLSELYLHVNEIFGILFKFTVWIPFFIECLLLPL